MIYTIISIYYYFGCLTAYCSSTMADMMAYNGLTVVKQCYDCFWCCTRRAFLDKTQRLVSDIFGDQFTMCLDITFKELNEQLRRFLILRSVRDRFEHQSLHAADMQWVANDPAGASFNAWRQRSGSCHAFVNNSCYIYCSRIPLGNFRPVTGRPCLACVDLLHVNRNGGGDSAVFHEGPEFPLSLSSWWIWRKEQMIQLSTPQSPQTQYFPSLISSASLLSFYRFWSGLIKSQSRQHWHWISKGPSVKFALFWGGKFWEHLSVLVGVSGRSASVGGTCAGIRSGHCGHTFVTYLSIILYLIQDDAKRLFLMRANTQLCQD